jgi:hypothetical protein
VIHQERTETSPRCHYTWMTTKEYRRRFAYLAYESGAGSHFFVQSQGSVREYADLPILWTPDGAFRIPREVAGAGLVELTSVIHPWTAEVGAWQATLQCQSRLDSEGPPRQWPPETGGGETLLQIKQVCARANAGDWHPGRKNEDLDALVLPEKRRLQRNMTEAINHMLALLYGGGQ